MISGSVEQSLRTSPSVAATAELRWTNSNMPASCNISSIASAAATFEVRSAKRIMRVGGQTLRRQTSVCHASASSTAPLFGSACLFQAIRVRGSPTYIWPPRLSAEASFTPDKARSRRMPSSQPACSCRQYTTSPRRFLSAYSIFIDEARSSGS